MNGQGGSSALQQISQKLEDEISIRNNVVNGIATIQAEIDCLKNSYITTHPQTSSTPVMSASGGSNPSTQPQPALYPPGLNAVGTMRHQAPLMNNINQFSPPTVPFYPQPPVNLFNEYIRLNSQLQSLRNELSKSNDNIYELYDITSRLKHEFNDQRQYDQRNNLIAHGWDDVPIAPRKHTQEYAENFTNYVVNKINQLFPDIDGGITSKDIDDTHIYRTKNNDRNSPKQLVIIRFCSRLMRNKIFSMKKNLKSTGYSITEHLTQFNLGLLKAAQKKLKNKKLAWTHYGKVLIQVDNHIQAIRDHDELEYYLG